MKRKGRGEQTEEEGGTSVVGEGKMDEEKGKGREDGWVFYLYETVWDRNY